MDIASMIGGSANSESQKNVPEKIAKAEEYKLKGNEAFKTGNLKEALRNYHVATIHIKGLMQTTEEQKKTIDAINLACQSNMVACYMKLEEWEKVMNTCTTILTKDPNNVKALFRRGRAHIFRQNLDLAKADLNAAKALSPNDKDVELELQRLSQKYKESEAKEKALYRGVMKNMFS
eukprot:TRINITY_DN4079_c0_g1_i2.p1 TRINITY_DN4079_c0_g1~~TRINITY_DN4079_c0_g1_i2.p1  ORF type:complete len:189 (+),score=47.26 TRINITY_DN4079_c0_g1_i2:39-569(+)